MIARYSVTTINQVYTGSITFELDSVEQAFCTAYGEPRIDVAGTIPSTPSNFTLAGGPALRYVRSQSPHTFVLDARTDALAATKVADWLTEMRARAASAKTTLMALPNPVNGRLDGTEQVAVL